MNTTSMTRAPSRRTCSLRLREVSVRHIQKVSRIFILKPTFHSPEYFCLFNSSRFRTSMAYAAWAFHCAMACASLIRFRSTERTTTTATTATSISAHAICNQLFAHVPSGLLVQMFVVMLRWVCTKHGLCFVEFVWHVVPLKSNIVKLTMQIFDHIFVGVAGRAGTVNFSFDPFLLLGVHTKLIIGDDDLNKDISAVVFTNKRTCVTVPKMCGIIMFINIPPAVVSSNVKSSMPERSMAGEKFFQRHSDRSWSTAWTWSSECKSVKGCAGYLQMG